MTFDDQNVQNVQINHFQLQEYKKLAKQIRKFYFKDAAIEEGSLVQYMKMLSDINFAYGIDKSAREHAAKTPSKTFYYR